ncbi:MAG: hypothetical protein AAB784_02515 [Patescibacteria group bacterium]
MSDHAFCGRHAHALRRQGGRMFSFTGTVNELRRRHADRAATKGLLSLYAPMKAALKAADPPTGGKAKQASA